MAPKESLSENYGKLYGIGKCDGHQFISDMTFMDQKNYFILIQNF